MSSLKCDYEAGILEFEHPTQNSSTQPKTRDRHQLAKMLLTLSLVWFAISVEVWRLLVEGALRWHCCDASVERCEPNGALGGHVFSPGRLGVEG